MSDQAPGLDFLTLIKLLQERMKDDPRSNMLFAVSSGTTDAGMDSPGGGVRRVWVQCCWPTPIVVAAAHASYFFFQGSEAKPVFLDSDNHDWDRSSKDRANTSPATRRPAGD